MWPARADRGTMRLLDFACLVPLPGVCLDDLQLPAYDAVTAALHALRVGVDAGELHGALCGYLAAHGDVARDDWMQRLAIDADADTVAADPVLDRLFRTTRAQFADSDLGFALLLPSDDTPVSARIDALLGWCRGYLGGFGLGAGNAPTLSPDAQEALQDLGRIAGFAVAEDEVERDEDALAEIAEFVRVAVLLLHADVARDADARRRLH